MSGPVTGTEQLLVMSSDGNYGLVSWTGSTLASGWQGSRTFPGWGPALVAAGPPMGYPPITAAPLAEIYAQISSAADPGSRGDLRSLYTNTNTAFSVSTWYAWLVSNPSPPAGSAFAQADWTTVQSQLLAETQALTVVLSLYANLQALAGDILNQQNMDLALAIQLANPQQQGNSQVGFWLEQVFDALLWGAAALCSELPAMGFGLSALASLLGTTVNSSQTGPTMIEYTEIEQQIDAAYAATVSLNGMGQTDLVADALKCAVVRWMSVGAWAWPASRGIDMAAATQSANRIAFYQMLLPAIYTQYSYQQDDYGPYWDKAQKAPSYAYRGYQTEHGTYQLYPMAAWWHPASAGWPSQDLMNDLWACGVQPWQFWQGDGPWSVMLPATALENQ